jgi:hypothetical protein
VHGWARWQEQLPVSRHPLPASPIAGISSSIHRSPCVARPGVLLSPTSDSPASYTPRSAYAPTT